MNRQSETLAHLADAARGGDETAEKELFDRLTVRLRWLAKRTVGEEDADDLAQEAVMTILRKYRDEQFHVSFDAWSYGVLRMTIGNYLQRQKRRGVPLEIDPERDQTAPSNPLLLRSLLDCLRGLRTKTVLYARILNLVHQGYPPEDICERLDLTRTNYYAGLSRGRAHLRACLDKKGLN